MGNNPEICHDGRNYPLKELKKGQILRSYCANQLFEEQVNSSPEVDAVVFENEKLSYRELNKRANRFANYLIKRGVISDDLVGLCIDRSIDMLIAILAIWKSGGGYVPIDPNYPIPRISFIIKDSRCKFFVTKKTIYESIENNGGGGHAWKNPIFIDSEEIKDEIDIHSDKNPEIGERDGKNLAYAIYTSGSTGEPKGVAVEHRSLVNLFESLSEILEVKSFVNGYNALQNASISFDSSVKQLLHMMHGGTLHILSEERRSSPALFYKYLIENKICFFDVTPSMAKVMIPYLKQKRERNHRFCILVGGEAIDSYLWGVLGEIPNSQCLNVYGPTECTVDTTFSKITLSTKKPIIGKPIKNVYCHVLDDQGNKVSENEIGELYIGGAGVARGYLNRLDLTEERFVKDPFSENGSARLYRSGDLVRILSDGNLEFVGRVDDQVKIRGYRIELGEIESCLVKQQGVSEAVVIVRGDRLENKTIVAYIVPDNNIFSEGEINIEKKLMEDLRRSLPGYMLPSLIIPIELIPLTSNGKADRKALAKKENNFPVVRYIPASSELELLLVNIWEELLKLSPIGVQDSFFALGGHSLLAMQLAAKIEEKVGVPIKVGDVFKNPTIKNLSRYIEQSNNVRENWRIEKAPVGSRVVSYEEETLYRFGSSVQPPLRMTVEITGNLDVDEFSSSLSMIFERHEIFNTRYIEEENGIYRVIDPDINNQIKFYDFEYNHNKEEEIEFFKRKNSSSISLKGSMYAATIFRLEKHSYIFDFVIAHILFDMWSFDNFMKEISVIYGRLIHKKSTASKKPSVSYADHAHSQTLPCNINFMKKKIIFWENKLKNFPAMLTLPMDRKRSDQNTFLMRSIKLEVPQYLAKEIKDFCLRENTTLFIAILTVIDVLLSYYSNEKDVVVICPVTSRNGPDLDNVMGCFVNMLVTRNTVNVEASFTEQLETVKAGVIESFDYQDVPFLVIQEILRNKLKELPSQLFQIILDVNPPLKDFELPGLRTSNLSVGQLLSESENPGRSFDLVFMLRETQDGMTGRITYDAKLFNEESVKTIARDFFSLLSLLLANRNMPMSNVLTAFPS